jgi:hypothetical protein
MSPPGFTLILTKGTHLVSETTAAAILHAVKEREPLVDIELDPFGGSEPRKTSLATAHVVALTRNPDVAPAAPANAPDNVRRLHARR